MTTFGMESGEENPIKKAMANLAFNLVNCTALQFLRQTPFIHEEE